MPASVANTTAEPWKHYARLHHKCEGVDPVSWQLTSHSRLATASSCARLAVFTTLLCAMYLPCTCTPSNFLAHAHSLHGNKQHAAIADTPTLPVA